MLYTINYNLKKPEGTDVVNIEDLNENADIIDQKLKELEDGVVGAQTEANEAEARAKAYTDQEVGEVSQELAEHKAEIATSTQLGHVKVGQNLAIDSDGNLHASGGKKVVRFVIGTSTAGWAENDVDYLCDGVDDQVEINNAIQALPDEGGEIIILDGTYNISATINVNKDNVSIRGNGNATVLKRMWDSSSPEGVISLTSVQGCRIENLQIDGNKTIYDNSGCNYGIYLVSCSNNIVTGNTCNNNFYQGISLKSSTNNIIIDNICNNSNIGIYLNLSDKNIITGNNYNDNGSYGIQLYSSSNNIITGNICNDNYCGIFLFACNNNTITGNTCIRGTGTPEDYNADQYTINIAGLDNNYNLISSNNCMGKAVVIVGGTGNSAWGNKFDNTDDLP